MVSIKEAFPEGYEDCLYCDGTGWDTRTVRRFHWNPGDHSLTGFTYEYEVDEEVGCEYCKGSGRRATQ